MLADDDPKVTPSGNPRPADSQPSTRTMVVAGAVVAVSALYLANPGFGIVELIPDNIPVIGNLDEALAAWALAASLAVFGIEIPMWAGRRGRAGR